MSVIFFSIGGESLCVAQNTYAVKWFQGKELNMVFGLQLSFSRVVSGYCKMTRNKSASELVISQMFNFKFIGND